MKTATTQTSPGHVFTKSELEDLWMRVAAGEKISNDVLLRVIEHLQRNLSR